MKLILAIVNNDDSASVTSALTGKNYKVTRLSTTGGFLNVGNTTLLIGTEDDNVDEVKEIIKKYCPTRKQVKSSRELFGRGANNGIAQEVTVGGATYFVLGVDETGSI